ncbi:MAG: exopolysaccharide biosynthesis protein [Actinobacteria bacterium]|nr:exopolysaccharide biosynthesis protein [Actinomycetota bacterium]
MPQDRPPGDGPNKHAEPTQADPKADSVSLGETLDAVIEALPPGKVDVATIRDLLGEDSMLILAAFLTIVFLVPVSIPGVSTVFGTIILLIAFTRMAHRTLWIPRRIAERELSSDKIGSALVQGAKWLHRLERISRPRRWRFFVSGPADVVNNVVVVVCTLMLMVPLGLVPFTNTLPALALLFLFVGLIQKDGVCIVGGYLFGIATVAYFTFLALGGGAVVQALVQQLGAIFR